MSHGYVGNPVIYELNEIRTKPRQSKNFYFIAVLEPGEIKVTDCCRVWPFICLTVYLFVWPFSCLSDSLVVCLTVYLFVWPFSCLSDSLVVCLTVYQFVWPFICLSNSLPVYLTVYLFIWQFTCLYDSLPVCLTSLIPLNVLVRTLLNTWFGINSRFTNLRCISKRRISFTPLLDISREMLGEEQESSRKLLLRNPSSSWLLE